MSGWGKLDSRQLSGNILVTTGSANVSNSLGNATFFLNEVKPGDYFAAGPITAPGSNLKYYVSTVVSNVLLRLSTTYLGATANGRGNIQQGPKAVHHSNIALTGNAVYNIQRIYGIDSVEANVTANKGNNINQPGWVHQVTYTDAFGARRVKTETLVAMSKNFNRDNTAVGNALSRFSGNLLTDANDDVVAKNS